ncbi:MAG: substrate-binding domain-containing protein, partial [Nitrososphaera sp.]
MRTWIEKTILVLVAAMLPWFSLDCQGQGSERKRAYIVPTLANPFFVDMTTAAREAAHSHADVELIVQAPPDFTNVDQQVSFIENAVILKVAAICLVAADSKGVVPVLRKAQDAKIPVLLVDNTVDPLAAKNAGLTIPSHVESDNVLGGKLAGQFIGKTLEGRGEVAMLEGVLGSDVANALKRGFLEALDRASLSFLFYLLDYMERVELCSGFCTHVLEARSVNILLTLR